GLVDRVDVSQYRLAAHLTLAAIIFAAIIWVALGVGGVRQGRLRWGALALVVIIVVQIATGGLVAGLDAGMAYNTWPLIDGAVIPDGLLDQSPVLVNFFENVLTVQFQHRMLAYLVVIAALDEALRSIRGRADEAESAAWAMIVAVLTQLALGIATLLAQVPLSLALLHQAGAFLLLATAVWHLHSTALSARRG
ncbi:MAG: COX15/CtaA family protein, partial [Aestuariivirgaceae bacterium]